MQSMQKFFYPLPGNSNDFDPKDISKKDDEVIEPDVEQGDDAAGIEGEHGENKSFKTSLRDALQEWSNDDARDIEQDDSTP